VAAVARLLGISERGVRDRIERGTLDAIKEPGQRGWRILLPPAAAPETVALTASGGSPRGSEAVGEAVVTPTQIEQAIERTGQKYVTDMAALYDRISAELGQVYEGQIAAKDQALAAKDETIAELRRRAEQAEAERDRLTQAQALPDALESTETTTPNNPSVAPSAGLWARVRRVFGG